MQCRVCCATLYNSRSELCLACSSVATIQQEFLEGWRNTRLRNIGADIALSAARSIRALRIYGKSEDSTYPTEAKEVCKAETKEDSGKPPLERKRRSQGADFEGREKASKKTKAEVHLTPTVPRGKEESRGGPAQSSAARPGAPKETASEESYSSSTEDFEVKDLTGRGKKEQASGSATGTTPKSTAEALGKLPLRFLKQALRRIRTEAKESISIPSSIKWFCEKAQRTGNVIPYLKLFWK